MYEVMERVLSRELGADDDILYGGTSSSRNLYKTKEEFKPAEYWLPIYEAARVARNVSVYCPNYLGGEYLFSNRRGKGHYNNCLHRKSRLVNLPYLSLHSKYNYYNTGYLETYFRSPSPNVTAYDVNTLGHLGSADSTVRGRAWWNMQPRFQSGVSMQNFLYELKDFRDIGASLRNMGKLASLIGDAMTSARRSAAKGHTRNLVTLTTGSAAEAQLLFSFAIRPLIKDAMEIALASIRLADNAQQQFFESGLIPQKSHYSENLEYIDESVIGLYNAKWLKNGLVKRSDFTATLRYKYAYTMRNSREAFMKYWGFSSSLEAVWNSLPFSFLADYVFTVAKSIRAMEHDSNVDIHTLEYCESIKTVYKYGVLTSGDPIHHVLVLDGKFLSAYDDSCKLTKDILLAGVEGSIYERTVREPYKGPALPRLKLPSKGQMLNVAALSRCFLD